MILSAAGEKTVGIKLLSLEATITLQELLFQYSVLRNVLKSKANYLHSEKKIGFVVKTKLEIQAHFNF